MPVEPDADDVVRTAWLAAGSPIPEGIPFLQNGTCARCQTDTSVTRAVDVVSRNWTGWDTLTTARNPFICAACAWGYRNPPHRQDHLEIRRDGSVRYLSPTMLAEALGSAVLPDRAITIITTPNRKHALPVARWGRVVVDDVAIEWSDHQPSRLAVMSRLRLLGFGSRALAEPSPPYAMLRRHSGATRAEVMAKWPELDEWRGSAYAAPTKEDGQKAVQQSRTRRGPYWEAGVAACSHLTLDKTGVAA
ncbi:hypothetical protein GS504_01850 [Rhodococcus hoagii]|nr:hypothetical protein [Prescottella equi]NKS72232.1 hypothetical protein [Prescottella equi]